MHALLSEKKPPPFFAQNAFWPIRHGFFGLCGGISDSQHAVLQASCPNVDSDQSRSTTPNQHDRCAVIKTVASTSLSALNFTGMAWLSNQKHTNRVLVLPRDQRLVLQPADALITNDPHAIIGIITADCAPILIYDRVAKVIAAIHAGWRGAVSGVIEETITRMYALGATMPNLHATIGPMIRSESYQVSNDFLQTVQGSSDWSIVPMVRTAGDSIFFDLPLYIHKRLESLVSKTDDVKIDTFSRTDFFSHRRATHSQQQAPRARIKDFQEWQGGDQVAEMQHILHPEKETIGPLAQCSANHSAERPGGNCPNSHGRNISWISLTARIDFPF